MSHSVKNIVITGASSGLGAALAQAYAAPGIVLGLMGRNQQRLDQVAQTCRAQGAHVVTGLIDIVDETAIAAWVAEFDAQYPIDLCIANAGISAGTGGGDESLQQVKKMVDVNINGVLNIIHPVLDHMRTRKNGQVAMISSIAGWIGLPGAPAYGMSKAAVRVYGQGLRGLYESHGIQINVVCPGFIKTPMTDVNGFAMPFIMQADKAAQKIRQGLACNKGLIAFPWQQFMIVRLLSMLPDRFVVWFGKHLPAKPADIV